jgi:hypothetical protein
MSDDQPNKPNGSAWLRGLRSETQQQADTPKEQPTPQATRPKATPYERWYNGLSDEHRALIDNHIQGQHTALRAEREGNKTLAKQIRETEPLAIEARALQAQLAELEGKAASAQRRAGVYLAAARAGAARDVFELIALAADSSGIGDIDQALAAVKQKYPSLFTKQAPGTIAGAGLQRSTKPPSFNDMLRGAPPTTYQQIAIPDKDN